MESADMVRMFRALSCKKRFAMIKLLLKQESCVGTIAEKLESSQSSISQHLRVLRDSGLVTDHRYGYHIHYTANREILEQIMDGFSEMLSDTDSGAECPRKGKLCAEDAIVETAETN